MKALLVRALGFAVPTIGIVVALHLNEETSVGETIDGVASGLFFTVCFGGGRIIRGRTITSRRRSDYLTARSFLVGLAFACIVWVLLWGFCNLSITNGLRAYGPAF